VFLAVGVAGASATVSTRVVIEVRHDGLPVDRSSIQVTGDPAQLGPFAVVGEPSATGNGGKTVFVSAGRVRRGEVVTLRVVAGSYETPVLGRVEGFPVWNLLRGYRMTTDLAANRHDVRVTIDSPPAGARVNLSSADMDSTQPIPALFRVPRGSLVTLRVQAPGEYVTTESSFQVVKDTLVRLRRLDLKPGVLLVKHAFTPARREVYGLKVYADEQLVGTVGESVPLPAQTYLIRVCTRLDSASILVSAAAPVTIRPGRDTVVDSLFVGARAGLGCDTL
jgi:hypothetical protein